MGPRIPVLLTIVLLADAAAARVCFEVSQKEAYHIASVVFKGTAIRVEHMNMISLRDPETGKQGFRPPETDDAIMITFAVATAWKGPVAKTMKVFALSVPRTCCGYLFEKDKEYVVYGHKDINQDWQELRQLSEGRYVYGIGGCPLRIRTDVDAESRRLGRGHSPKED